MSIITKQDPAIPNVTRSKDELINLLVNRVCVSEILFPMNPKIPLDMLKDAIDMKIVDNDRTVEDVPIMEGVVIFDKINQKIYPENKRVIASIYK